MTVSARLHFSSFVGVKQVTFVLSQNVYASFFKCADDYYRSPECQNRVDPVPEGLYLNTIIKPLYRFMRDQGYEVLDGKFVRKEKDHDQIIGYDDINQLFWYPEGLAKIILQGGVCFIHFIVKVIIIILMICPSNGSLTSLLPNAS